MSRRSFAVLWLSLAVVVCVVYGISRGQEEAEPRNENPFADRIVAVYAQENPENGALLEDVEIKQVAGRPFLVGTSKDTGHDEDWTAGLEVGIAWESVKVYYIMDEEQFEEIYRDGR